MPDSWVSIFQSTKGYPESLYSQHQNAPKKSSPIPYHQELTIKKETESPKIPIDPLYTLPTILSKNPPPPTSSPRPTQPVSPSPRPRLPPRKKPSPLKIPSTRFIHSPPSPPKKTSAPTSSPPPHPQTPAPPPKSSLRPPSPQFAPPTP